MKENKNITVYLNDIYDCILKIEEYLKEFSEERFMKITKNKIPFCAGWKLLVKQ